MAWSFSKNSFTHDKALGGKSGRAVLDSTVTTGADTYATGGLVLAALATTYFATVESAEVINESGTYHVKWDGGTPAAGKLLVYVEDGVSGISAQVADMTDLSVTPGTLRVRFTGTPLATLQAAYSSGNGVT